MKKLSLFLLASTLLVSRPSQAITPIGIGGLGHTLFSEVATHVGCWNSGKCAMPVIPDVCTAVCAAIDLPYVWSIWIDFATAIATALDAAITWIQNDRTIDAQDAVDQLEASLGGGCSGASDDDTSLEPEAMDVLAPQIVVDSLNASKEELDLVRVAVENYVFETDNADINGTCTDGRNKCAENRQNTWALLSVSFAQAMGHKVISNTAKMDQFSGLVSAFNATNSPMGMWGAMSNMTVDTHIQMNDINALFARDLEMSALGGLNNSGVHEFKRSGI